MTGRAQPAWVSVEGINGIGKTHLTQCAAHRLGPDCLALVELGDATPSSLPGDIIAALRAGGDLFLRTGSPRTETLLLLALQVHRHEHAAVEAKERLVLEDRGLLSVAVYQAVIAETSKEAALETARTILETAAPWRPAPSTTVMILDDFEVCLDRFEHRIGRRVRDDERDLIDSADQLYQKLLQDAPEQFHVIDRRTTTETEAVEALIHICHQFLSTHAVRRAP